jgi:hypothetical protein
MYCADSFSGAPTLWPWPKEDWLYNQFTIDAMRTVYFMKELLDKDANLWTPEEDAFYADIHGEVEENGIVR